MVKMIIWSRLWSEEYEKIHFANLWVANGMELKATQNTRRGFEVATASEQGKVCISQTQYVPQIHALQNTMSVASAVEIAQNDFLKTDVFEKPLFSKLEFPMAVEKYFGELLLKSKYKLAP